VRLEGGVSSGQQRCSMVASLRPGVAGFNQAPRFANVALRHVMIEQRPIYDACDQRGHRMLRRLVASTAWNFDHCTLKQATHAGWLVVSVRVALLWRSMSMANRIFGVIHLVSVRTQVYHPKLWLYSHGLSVRHCAHCKRLLELNLAGSD
jgi:hypothetical protein